MIAPGDTVCVALSGGADSVCLFLMLLEIYGARKDRECGAAEGPEEENSRTKRQKDESCRIRPVQIHAVHVNHQLRGADADADERFVRELCSRHGVPLSVYRFPVGEIAAEKRIGTEEAGRLVRHEAYRDCLENRGAAVIALAHHANDRAETFLFHAARGTSPAGLAGIRPVQSFAGIDAALVRPILCLTRSQIEEWLRERGQMWRTDETNEDEAYTRNVIRHEVIPLLESRVNARAAQHIAEVCADLEETDCFLREEALQRGKKYIQVRGNGVMICASVLEQPQILQGYILLNILEKTGGTRKDLGRKQVRQLQELFSMQAGKRVDLPYDLHAVREYDGIRLYRSEQDPVPADGEDPDNAVPVIGPGTYLWNGWRFSVQIREVPRQGSAGAAGSCSDDIPRKKYTKWLDCDKINGSLCIRGRQNADRLVVNARGGRKKLKDYLIDEKVPREERDRIPLLSSGERVYWVVGYRISEDAKVTERTRRILEITAEPPAAEQQSRRQQSSRTGLQQSSRTGLQKRRPVRQQSSIDEADKG